MEHTPLPACPECQAIWQGDQTCQEHFNQMLYWENEYPGYGEVHHLMVLCFYLQHPSLYSPEGLVEGRRLLDEFLNQGKSTTQVRRTNRVRVSSTNRDWKIKGTPGNTGAYAKPVHWSMTAADVVSRGHERYTDSVLEWARSVYESLQQMN